MKKIYTILPAWLLSLMLLGCGGGSSSDVVLKDVASIAIDPAVYEIPATAGVTLTCSVNYDNGSTSDATDYVVWSTSNAALAKVAVGSVSRAGSAGGEVNITASYEQFSSYVTVNVHRLSDMNITVNDANTKVNSQYQLTVEGIFTDTLTDSNVTHVITDAVAWTLSDATLATLDQNGTLTTLDKNGTLQVMAELYENNATIDLNITY